MEIKRFGLFYALARHAKNKRTRLRSKTANSSMVLATSAFHEFEFYNAVIPCFTLVEFHEHYNSRRYLDAFHQI